MNLKIENIVEQIIPFILVGIAIALVIGLFIVLSYALVWGIILGGILWIASLLKQYLFPSAQIKHHKGRIIEHDDKHR